MDTPTPTRHNPQTVQLVTAVVECVVIVEAMWYVMHNEYLHERALEALSRVRERIAYRAQVLDTLRTIRRLPE